MSVVSVRPALTMQLLMLGLFMAAPAAAHQHPSRPGEPVEVPASGSITVVGKEFKFIPSAIRVKQGQHVSIVFENAGALSHNLTIPGLGLHTDTIQTGTQATLRFTAKKAGTYRFWCTVPGHKEAGMRGEVIVR